MDLFGPEAKHGRDLAANDAIRERREATQTSVKAARIHRKHFDVAVGLVKEERVAAMLTECFDGAIEALGGPSRS